MEEELTVPEILQGLLRKEYIEHRTQLLELLTNQFANENESDCRVVVAKSTTPQSSDTDNAELAVPHAPRKIDKATWRQVLRIMLEFASNRSFSFQITNLSLAVIVNATIKPDYVTDFLEILQDQSANNTISIKFHNLIQEFLDYNPQEETEETTLTESFSWDEYDRLQYIGSILCNLCQQDLGRKLLLHTERGYMMRFPPQVRSRNPVRRRGSVGCIRSCLFDQDSHWWMLNEVRVLTPLLIPLTVPTPFTEKDKEGMDPTIWIQAENPDKKYESDLTIMKLMIECLILLCQRRGIREELRKRKVYPVMRNLDLKIEDESVSAAIYEVVNFLIGDEDPNTPIDRDDSHQKAIKADTE